MPSIRRRITKLLKQTAMNQDFVAAALVDLIACTAIRPGSEAYVRERGTRGAATLLKKHVQTKGDNIVLCFHGKNGKRVEKAFRSHRLALAIRRLQRIPGNRLFQYLADDGAVRKLRRRDANSFLCGITDSQVSLKDFRTLSACSQALEYFARLEPRPSENEKRGQIKSTLRAVANELANTPAVCKRSYVHSVVVEAFETGRLKRMASNGRPRGHALLRKILRRGVGNPRLKR
jgi:DNA topoisomerase I